MTYSRVARLMWQLATLSSLLFVLLVADGNAQAPTLEWEKGFNDGWSSFTANFVRPTADGGFVALGSATALGADVKVYHDSSDSWVVKTDWRGAMEWQVTLGGSGVELESDIQQTTDGGYIVAITSSSNDYDVSGHHGLHDWWIVKLSSLGTIAWQHCYGGSDEDYITSIQQTTDGGYVASGYTQSVDGDFLGSTGYHDTWVLKLDSAGLVQWKRQIGGGNSELGNAILQTSDGGYVVAGENYSWDIPGSPLHGGSNSDAWVAKLSASGVVQWQKLYGGSGYDAATAITQTHDGGYLVAGWCRSGDGDVIGAHPDTSGKVMDIWMLRLSSSGSILWSKCLGGSGMDYPRSTAPTADGGIVVAGDTWSYDGDVIGLAPSLSGSWILKISEGGALEWQDVYKDVSVMDIRQSFDGGFIVAGNADDIVRPVSGSFWLGKLGAEALQTDVSDAVFSIVMPQPAARDVDMGTALVGSRRDSTVQSFVSNTGTYPFTVRDIRMSGPQASLFSLVSGTPPFVVAPGTSQPVEFRFHPQSAGSAAAQVDIITQTDTLHNTIQGNGVQPTLSVVGKVIDFGAADVGTDRDTINAVTIANTGGAPLAISSTRHAEPNSIDFTTIAGGGMFTLNPGDTARLDLRFHPSRAGRTSGRLLFDHGGPGSPATVILYGEGRVGGARITAADVHFPAVVCTPTSVDTVTMHNTGSQTLVVSAAVITGADAADFALDKPFTSLTIAPDSSANIALTFTPSAAGNRAAALELHSNSAVDSVLTLALTGSRETAVISANAGAIDLGFLCPNEPRDTVLILSNNGTVKNAVRAQATGLTLGSDSITLAAGTSQNVIVHFPGAAAEGAVDEVISLTDSLCAQAQSVHVTVRVASPHLAAADLSIAAFVGGGQAEGVLTVHNAGTRPATITSAPAIAPFVFVAPAFPVVVPATDSVTLRIGYTAVDTMPQSAPVTFSADPCATSLTLQLNGSGSSAFAAMGAGSVSGYPGDLVDIPVVLTDTVNLAVSAATTLSTTLAYNASLLAPVGSTPQGTLSPDRMVRTIPLTFPLPPQNGVLGVLHFRAMLGNDTTTSLALTSAAADVAGVAVTAQAGTFTLLGVCRQGGPELFYSNGVAQISAMRPNPVQDQLIVEYHTIESGPTVLRMVNTLGMVVAEASQGPLPVGQHTLTLSMRDVPPGIYSVELRTPTIRDVQRVVVVK